MDRAATANAAGGRAAIAAGCVTGHAAPWARAARELLDRIDRGGLRPGSLIPPRGKLAADLGVSAEAAGRAVRWLSAQDMLRLGGPNRYTVAITAPDRVAEARDALRDAPAAAGRRERPPAAPRFSLAAAGLRRLRVERGLTQGEAAELLGVWPSAVCRIEQGTRRPLPARRVAAAFGVAAEDVTAVCGHCGYDPPDGYLCLHCGTPGRGGEGWTLARYATTAGKLAVAQ
jgi:transcriptional regulator with XRE-family HTH domain